MPSSDKHGEIDRGTNRKLNRNWTMHASRNNKCFVGTNINFTLFVTWSHLNFCGTSLCWVFIISSRWQVRICVKAESDSKYRDFPKTQKFFLARSSPRCQEVLHLLPRWQLSQTIMAKPVSLLRLCCKANTSDVVYQPSPPSPGFSGYPLTNYSI